MTLNRGLVLQAAIIFCSAALASSTFAQSDISFSGVLFSDYSYTLETPEGNGDDEHGFELRRVYLTADFKISESFSGRFRLEGNDRSVTSQGKLSPFVKDLFLTWNNALGDGHNVTFGLSSPPIWGVAENHWAYRSLEKTIQHRNGIASSRDMGLTLSGPVLSDGRVKYALMYANNSGVKRETDKFKRVYGQLQFYPSGSITLSLGGDYYLTEDGTSYNASAFVGYATQRAQIGLEAFYNPKSIDSDKINDTALGVSAFGFVNTTSSQRLIARYDLVNQDNPVRKSSNHWMILGYSFTPEKGVEIIPNAAYHKNDFEDRATITARLTVVASF